MKRFFYFFREAVIASAWPVLFILLLISAFLVDSLFSGLFILLGAAMLQVFAVSDSLVRRRDNLLRWNRFSKFSDWEAPCLGETGIIAVIANLILNLLKVATIACIVVFIQLKFSSRTLTTEGWLIVIFFSVVAMLSMSKGKLFDYRMVRAYLGFLVTLCLLALALTTFGSQLIWVTLFLAILFVSHQGFEELKALIGVKFYKELVLFALLVTGLASTIYQFYYPILRFFSETFQWLKELPNILWEFFMSPEFAPWGIGFLVLILIAILFFVGREVINSIKESREKKIATELTNKKNQEKMILEEKISNQFQELLNCDYDAANKPFTLNDLLFIISNKSYKGLSRTMYRMSLDSRLSKTNLMILLQVCDEKKQIVFDGQSAEILKLYDEAYARNYDDVLLRDLGNRISELISFLSHPGGRKARPIRDYKGSAEMMRLIYKELKNIPDRYSNPPSRRPQ